MTSKHWLDQLKQIASDFESADVKGLRFSKIDGQVKCLVTVLNADGELTAWELVHGGTRLDRWRKVDG